MSTTARLLAATGVVLAAAVLPGSSSASYAADAGSASVSIDHAQPVDGAVELLVSLPAGADPDLSGVAVSVAGEDVAATAAPALGGLVRRTAVLAIDTSLSMRGARIEAAEAAALGYLDMVPRDVEVGVVTFDDDVTTVLEPTRDRAAARAAVSDLELQRDTALYQGVVGAVKATGPVSATAGQRSVLLLSDGEDSTGDSLAPALRTVEDSGVLLDVVALQQSGPAAMPLQLLAKVGRGQVLDAGEPEALSTAFAAQAEALARQVVVTAQVPDGKATSADVSVAFPGATGELEATAFLPVRPGSDPDAEAAADEAVAEKARTAVAVPDPASGLSGLLSGTVALVAVGAVGVGLLGVLLTLALSRKSPDREERLRVQLQAYGVVGAPAAGAGAVAGGGPTGPETGASLGDQARHAAAKALAGQAGLEARIAARLEGAGARFTPAEWLLLHAGIALGTATLGLLLGGGSILLLLVGLVLGLVGPWVFLGFKQSARLKAFYSALPDTLQLMSGSLSAGLSLGQSIDTIVREGGEPIASEFRRVVVASRLGVPFEDALAEVAERMRSKDFAWVVMAIKIQREVGGNLAELLLTVAETLREREFLRRHVRALSAEGRLSAWILGALPPGFLLYLTATKPEYVNPLYTTPLGLAMLGGAAVVMAVGILWMVKAAKVEL